MQAVSLFLGLELLAPSLWGESVGLLQYESYKWSHDLHGSIVLSCALAGRTDDTDSSYMYAYLQCQYVCQGH